MHICGRWRWWKLIAWDLGLPLIVLVGVSLDGFGTGERCGERRTIWMRFEKQVVAWK